MSTQSITPEERLHHLEGHYADRVSAFRHRHQVEHLLGYTGTLDLLDGLPVARPDGRLQSRGGLAQKPL